jgi:hypothetical protein
MKNKTISKIAGISVAASLALTPFAAFAHDFQVNANARAGEHAKVKAAVKADLKTNVAIHATTTPKNGKGSCLKAVGHLIAPGWIKSNGSTTVDASCKLPFGIAKKLGMERPPHTGTSTPNNPDTSAPALFAVMSSTGTSTATVTWFTSERSTSKVEYGTTTSYGSASTLDADLTFFHSVSLNGLDPSTTYHFRVISKDAAGNAATSSDNTFTTKSLTDTSAPVISGFGVSGVSSTSATVSWSTNEPSTSKVFYASGNSVDLATASSTASGALVTNHSLTLSGLSASTTYSIAVQSADAVGNTSTSATTSFVSGL